MSKTKMSQCQYVNEFFKLMLWLLDLEFFRAVPLNCAMTTLLNTAIQFCWIIFWEAEINEKWRNNFKLENLKNKETLNTAIIFLSDLITFK